MYPYMKTFAFHRLTIFVLSAGLAVILVIAAVTSSSSLKTNSKSTYPESVESKETVQSLEQQADEKSQVKLSDDANYPAPVIQLQKAMAEGMANVEEPSLPLLRGDLKDFADQNIDQAFDKPQELVELEQRIKRLKALQN